MMTNKKTFLDSMTSNLVSDSGLLVTAAGLGALQVVSKMIGILIENNNEGLTLILNTTAEFERYVDDHLTRRGIERERHPSKLHLEITPKVREDQYSNGQVCSVASNYLIVDILSGRLQLSGPDKRLKRCVVWNAHQVSSRDSPESFILRMIKEKSPETSFHCITDSPDTFIHKSIDLNMLLKNLCINTVWLWPRFHVQVQKDLTEKAPLEVVEMQAKLPRSVAALQNSFISIIDDMISELKNKLPKQQPGTSFELSAAGVIAGSLSRYIKEEIGSTNTISSTIKQVLSELEVLKKLLNKLHSMTSVDFLEHLEYQIQIAEGSIGGAAPSSWLMSAGARLLLPQAKSRILRFGKIDLEREQSFSILTEILKDIKSDWKTMGPGYNSLAQGATFTGEQRPTVLILVKDRQSLYNVQRVIHNGEHAVMQNLLKRYVNNNYKESNMMASQLKELHPKEKQKDYQEEDNNEQVNHYYDRSELVETIQNSCEVAIPDGCFDLHDDDDDAEIDLTQPSLNEPFDSSSDDPLAMTLNSSDSDDDADISNPIQGEQEPQQRLLSKRSHSRSQSSIKKKKNEPSLASKKQSTTRDMLSLEIDQNFTIFGGGSGPNIIIHTSYQCSELLEGTQPGWIILYDPNMAAIRKMEVYAMTHPDWRTRVYVMGNSDSTEQQKTLTAINNEMKAFKWLAQRRASLASNESLASANNTNPQSEGSLAPVRSKRGGGLLSCIRSGGKVLVDTREFRCKLPSAIYRSRLVPIPVFIEVADYVLTDDIAVERKSVPDLMGSLQSGRLLQQIEALDKKYLTPVLLIEFEGNLPFCLTAGETWNFQNSRFDKKLWLTERLTPAEKTSNCLEKLIALSVLFPSLKILWSRDQAMTALLFEEIKRGRPEPSEDAASDRNINHTDAAIEFLKKIPGITPHNLPQIGKNFSSIAMLSQASESSIADVIGELPGKAVFRFFNDSHN